jgi:hypothetical protein
MTLSKIVSSAFMSVFMLSVACFYCNADFRYAEGDYGEKDIFISSNWNILLKLWYLSLKYEKCQKSYSKSLFRHPIIETNFTLG